VQRVIAMPGMKSITARGRERRVFLRTKTQLYLRSKDLLSAIPVYQAICDIVIYSKGCI
jgi:hypothetical protein